MDCVARAPARRGKGLENDYLSALKSCLRGWVSLDSRMQVDGFGPSKRGPQALCQPATLQRAEQDSHPAGKALPFPAHTEANSHRLPPRLDFKVRFGSGF